MTLEEFKKNINFRSVEKCCRNCKHCTVGIDNYGTCYDPALEQVEDKEKVMYKDARGWHRETGIECVCDKWEEEKA